MLIIADVGRLQPGHPALPLIAQELIREMLVRGRRGGSSTLADLATRAGLLH